MDFDFSSLRRDHDCEELKIITDEPFTQLKEWLDKAFSSNIKDPNAMVLSTVSEKSVPTSRVVLLKEIGENSLSFFTNLESRKVNDLRKNPNVSLNFYWPEIDRQICIVGTAQEVSRKRSNDYFQSRPKDSQISAWASKQSRKLEKREDLIKKYLKYEDKFIAGDIPLPDFWGGFEVIPQTIEFWVGRKARLHDRVLYTRNGESWEHTLLNP